MTPRSLALYAALAAASFAACGDETSASNDGQTKGRSGSAGKASAAGSAGGAQAGSSQGGAGGQGGASCLPGQQLPCACPGTAAQGVQLCQSDGHSLGPCSGCPAASGAGGGAGSAGTSGAGSGGAGGSAAGSAGASGAVAGSGGASGAGAGGSTQAGSGGSSAGSGGAGGGAGQGGSAGEPQGQSCEHPPTNSPTADQTDLPPGPVVKYTVKVYYLKKPPDDTIADPVMENGEWVASVGDKIVFDSTQKNDSNKPCQWQNDPVYRVVDEVCSFERLNTSNPFLLQMQALGPGKITVSASIDGVQSNEVVVVAK